MVGSTWTTAKHGKQAASFAGGEAVFALSSYQLTGRAAYTAPAAQ